MNVVADRFSIEGNPILRLTDEYEYKTIIRLTDQYDTKEMRTYENRYWYLI